MKKLLICLSVMCAPLSGWAAKIVGNGGDGVKVNGKIYVLDLFEAGVHADPYFASDVTENPEFTKRLTKAFINIKGVPIELLSRKLNEINQVDPVMARQLLRTMELYVWSGTDANLPDIDDTQDLVVEYPKDQLVQLAIRKSRSILLQNALWAMLDAANRVALIFHEVFYALMPIEKSLTDARAHFQSSERAREVTRHLFLPSGYSRVMTSAPTFPERACKTPTDCELTESNNFILKVKNSTWPVRGNILINSERMIWRDPLDFTQGNAYQRIIREFCTDWGDWSELSVGIELVYASAKFETHETMFFEYFNGEKMLTALVWQVQLAKAYYSPMRRTANSLNSCIWTTLSLINETNVPKNGVKK